MMAKVGALFSGIILIVPFLMLIRVDGEEKIRRSKRYVPVFPTGGTMKIVLGLAIPVKLGSRQSMAVGWNFQFQYAEGRNITEYKNYPPVIRTRNRDKREENYRKSDRMLAYAALESLMDKYGTDGRSCLLRSICENAMDILHHEENGLYGHLLDVALTPDYGGVPDPDLDPVYLEAKTAGMFGVDCLSLYPGCGRGKGLLDVITSIATYGNDYFRY